MLKRSPRRRLSRRLTVGRRPPKSPPKTEKNSRLSGAPVGAESQLRLAVVVALDRDQDVGLDLERFEPRGTGVDVTPQGLSEHVRVPLEVPRRADLQSA